MTCASCQHSDYDKDTAPILYCKRHGDHLTTSPCAQHSRYPGADEPEEVKK